MGARARAYNIAPIKAICSDVFMANSDWDASQEGNHNKLSERVDAHFESSENSCCPAARMNRMDKYTTGGVGLSAASGAEGLSMLVGIVFATHGNPSLLYVQRSLVADGSGPLATALQHCNDCGRLPIGAFLGVTRS